MKKDNLNKNIFCFFAGSVIAVLMIARPLCAGAQEGDEASLLSSGDLEASIRSMTDPFSLPQELKKMIEDKKAKEKKAEVVRKTTQTATVKKEPPPPPPLPKVKMTGVIYKVSKPLAILNGKVYGEGESIPFGEKDATGTVSSIKDGIVTILYVGVSHRVSMDQSGDQKKKK